MHAGGGVEIGVDRGHHRGHRAPGGESGHVHPGGVCPVAVGDLAGDPGDQRRLAGAAALVTGREPVPVPARVRRGGLLGVGDEQCLTLGQVVHAGGGGEGRGVLGAAVQHHDQGHGAAGVAGGDVEPVAAGAGGVAVGEGVKPARRPLHGRDRGPVRPAESLRAPAGEQRGG